MVAPGGWPRLGYEERTWTPDPAHRGPRADRTLGTFRAAVPPRIARAAPDLSPATASLCEHVRRAAQDLQSQTTADLGALTGSLLRSESVASSKIERLSATQADVALAAFGAAQTSGGRPAATNARGVAANIAAMTRAIALVGPGQPVTREAVLAVHYELLKDDPSESSHAGRTRSVQNWIGGSDYSPRGALFVPPAPGRVDAALNDLLSFCARPEVDPVARAAIAHAQFETIHPFTDGNGRTGRALVHLVWRSTEVAPRAVVTVSTALLADVDAYFHGLTRYRDGDVDAWVAQFADAALRAADAASTLARAIESLHERWRDQAGHPRAGSAATALLRGALSFPVMDVDTAATIAPVVRTSLYRALDALADAGVLVEVTGFRRNRVWYAPDLFELLERFELSLGRRGRPSVEALLP